MTLSRTTGRLILGVVFTFSLFGFVGEAKADMLTAPANISSCGQELATGGTYTLTQSISTSTGSTCLTITSPDVVITDGGNGYTISGNVVADAVFSNTPGFDFTVAGNIAVDGNISMQGNGSGQTGTVSFNGLSYFASGNTSVGTENTPQFITLSPDGVYIYVVNRNTNTLQKFSTATMTQVDPDAPTGSGPSGIAISPDGAYAYVASYDNGDLEKISTASMTQVGVLSGTGFATYAVTLSPDGAYAYVANHDSSFIVKVRTSDMAQIGSNVPTGGWPYSIAVSPDGAYAYVVCGSGNVLQKFSTDTMTRVDSVNTESGPVRMSISPDGAYVYFVNSGSNTIQKFSTASMSQVGPDAPTGSGPSGIAISPDGAYVYFVNSGSNTIQKFSTASMSQVGSDANTDSNPNVVAISPDGAHVYVMNYNSNTIQKFSTASMTQMANSITGNTYYSDGLHGDNHYYLSGQMTTLDSSGTGLWSGHYYRNGIDVSLSAGTINKCGVIASSGTYTLASDLTFAGDCFTVLADGATIDGAGHTVTGDGSGTAINAAAVFNGTNGFSVIVQNLTISNFSTGINASGANGLNGSSNNGYPSSVGSGGTITIASSTVGSIISNGGNGGDDDNCNYSSANGGNGGNISISNSPFTSINTNGGNGGNGPYAGYGGNGGSITINGTNIDLSNTSIYSSYGSGGGSWYGDGNGSNGLSGILTVSASTILHENTTLGSFSSFTLNGSSLDYYPGGAWPVFPGNISSCGTLLGSGTYRITQDISSSGNCFKVLNDGVTISGNGHTVTGNGSGYFVDATGQGNAADGHSVNIQNIIANNFYGGVIADGQLNDIYVVYGGGYGGSGGDIAIASSTLGSVSSIGGGGGDDYNWWGWQVGYYGGNAGTINISDSTVTDIFANGGVGGSGYLYNSYVGNGGNAGIIYLTKSNFNTIYASSGSGGSNWYDVYYNGYAGSPGTVSITGDNLNLTNKTISAPSGILNINYTGTFIADSTTSHSSFSSVTFQEGTNAPVIYSSVLLGDVFNNAGITITPRTLYFNDNNTGDPQWFNLSNWWNDSNNSSQAETYPRDGDTVYVNTYLYDSNSLPINLSDLYITSGNEFYVGGINSGTTTFSNGSYNFASIQGNVSFRDTSYNSEGYIDGDASFYDSSYNAGTVTGVCRFYDSSLNRGGSCGSVEYHKPFYFNNAAGDGDWNNVNNWWYDSNFTIPAIDGNGNQIIPRDGDTVYLYASVTTAPATPVSLNNIYSLKPFSQSFQRGISSGNFVSIASSADGKKVIAGQWDGYVYMSDDYGASWTQVSDLSYGDWESIAMSSDGTKIAIVDVYYGGYVYTSSNGGTSWTTRSYLGPKDNWSGITISSDGTKLAVSVGWRNGNGYIYTSSDSGATWTQQTSAGQRTWRFLSASSDGTKLVAVDGSPWGSNSTGYIYTSTDSGATWTERTSLGAKAWGAITSSSDGIKLAVAERDGYIYTSTDSGATWTQQTSAESRSWSGISSSADGTKLFAAVRNGYLYTSTDSGATWTQQTSAGSKTWYTNTFSSDGVRLFATVESDGVYVGNQRATPASISLNLNGISANNIYAYGTTTISGSYSGTLHLFGNRSFSQVNQGTFVGSVEFNNTTENDANINGNATFTGTNQNNGTVAGDVNNSGILSGTGDIGGNLTNSGIYANSGTTTGQTTNTGTINSGTFVDTVTNIAGSIGGAVNNLATMVFNTTSHILSGGSISGDAELNSRSSNGGTIGGDSTFNDYSSNIDKGLPSNVVAYWGLDTNASDISGNGYNGAVNGNISFDSNNGATFDGNSSITTPSNSTDFSSGLTISLWAKPTPFGGMWFPRFIDFGNGAQSNNIDFNRSYNGNDLHYEVWGNGYQMGALNASNGVINNEWHYYTITQDASGNTILYRDGVQLTSGHIPLPNNVTRNNNYIGQSSWGDPLYQGKMKDLGIWNRALSQSEIQSLYNGSYGANSSTGHVLGNATFVGDNSENTIGGISGIVDGVKSRLYTALAPQINLLRDFTDSAWTVIADNTFVKLISRSLVDLFTPNSATHTTLVTRNGGFILAPLDPSKPVTSCGVLDVAGATYTLGATTSIANYKYDTCFMVRADNITLNGNGRIVSAVTSSNATAIFAMASSTLGDTQTNAFTNLTVKNIKFLNFAHGIVARGLDVPSGVGGDGASTTLNHVTMGDIDLSGGDPDVKGGNGGMLTLITSTTTTILARGGDVNACSGIPGDGGSIVATTDSVYSPPPLNDGGVNHATNCNQGGAPVHSGSHGSVNNTVISDDTRASQAAAAAIAAANAKPAPSSHSVSVQAPGLQNIFTVLPPVVKLNPIKLTPVPTFGDTTTKNSFSLGEGITNFVFAPLPEDITKNLKTSTKLQTYLATQGFSKAQDLIALKKEPLLLKESTTTIPGLFTLKAAGLPVKLSDGNFSTNTNIDIPSYLTYNQNSSLSQLVKVSPKTQITINILPTNKGSVTAKFNGKEITFDKNSTTFKAPSTPGTYTLTTPSSPLTLIIEVVAPKSTSVQQTISTPTSWLTKLLNLFHF